jgi:hypothetical protein
MEAGRCLHVIVEIGILRFQFLQTDDVGILGTGPGQKALAPCRTNTVEVQRNDA